MRWQTQPFGVKGRMGRVKAGIKNCQNFEERLGRGNLERTGVAETNGKERNT